MADNGNETNGTQKKRLTPRQGRAIAALLASRNVIEAAQAARVGQRTLYRWLAEDEQFRRALAQAEGEQIDAAARRLLAGQSLALDALEGMLTDAEISASNKRLAAVAWLEFCLRWREVADFERRLAELEAAVYGKANR